MIKPLNHLAELSFPVATLKKPKDIKETQSTLKIDGVTLTKQGDLFSTFNIHVSNLPQTYAIFYTPGILLQDPKLINKKCLIDNKLNIFIPYNQVNIKQEARTIRHNKPPYFLVNGIEYYFEIEIPKTGKYPVLSYVDGVYYHSGWSDNLRYTNEFSI